MPNRATVCVLSLIALAGAGACQQKPKQVTIVDPSVKSDAQMADERNSYAATAAPPKMATMICRNSQTGASAECGTPNAVMVGIKEK